MLFCSAAREGIPYQIRLSSRKQRVRNRDLDKGDNGRGIIVNIIHDDIGNRDHYLPSRAEDGIGEYGDSHLKMEFNLLQLTMEIESTTFQVAKKLLKIKTTTFPVVPKLVAANMRLPLRMEPNRLHLNWLRKPMLLLPMLH